MPDHIHGIIELAGMVADAGDENSLRSSPKVNQFQKIIPRSVGSIVHGFKIGVTKWFRNNTEIYSVWHRTITRLLSGIELLVLISHRTSGKIPKIGNYE